MIRDQLTALREDISRQREHEVRRPWEWNIFGMFEKWKGLAWLEYSEELVGGEASCGRWGGRDEQWSDNIGALFITHCHFPTLLSTSVCPYCCTATIEYFPSSLTSHSPGPLTYVFCFFLKSPIPFAHSQTTLITLSLCCAMNLHRLPIPYLSTSVPIYCLHAYDNKWTVCVPKTKFSNFALIPSFLPS